MGCRSGLRQVQMAWQTPIDVFEVSIAHLERLEPPTAALCELCPIAGMTLITGSVCYCIHRIAGPMDQMATPMASFLIMPFGPAGPEGFAEPHAHRD